MKHAYLIIAHNEWDILHLLIKAIDDQRNDIFIHFDKKINRPPSVQAKHSKVFILEDRVKVYWAHSSMMEAELLLLSEAHRNGPYGYYHLLSGVDMPLKSQNEIHDFFRQHRGKEFIGFFQGNIDTELTRRVQRIHLFSRSLRESGGIINTGKRLVRFSFLKIQKLLGITKNRSIEFKKGTQWVSITNDFVAYLLSQRDSLLKMYQNTFCCDEVFIQTACWNSDFRQNIYDLEDESRGCMRKIGWRDGALAAFKLEDYTEIMQSDRLFARKFSSQHIDIAVKILKDIHGTY